MKSVKSLSVYQSFSLPKGVFFLLLFFPVFDMRISWTFIVYTLFVYGFSFILNHDHYYIGCIYSCANIQHLNWLKGHRAPILTLFYSLVSNKNTLSANCFLFFYDVKFILCNCFFLYLAFIVLVWFLSKLLGVNFIYQRGL